MRKPVAWFAVLAATCCLAGPALAGPRDVPHRYIPGSLDGGLQTIVRADGVAFGVWAYRSGAEYDIAVSRTDASGRWGEPEFFGALDGWDQVEPALAVDSLGNVFLAYTDRSDGSIRLSALPASGGSWSQPVPVRSLAGALSRPVLRVVADRLVVAFDTGTSLAMVDFALGTAEHPAEILPLTITESGDPVENRPGGDIGATVDHQVFGKFNTPLDVVTPIGKKRY